MRICGLLMKALCKKISYSKNQGAHRNSNNLLASLLILILAVSCFTAFPSCRHGGTAIKADLLLINATIWTADPAFPEAEAVAIRDHRILDVGQVRDLMKYRGPGTRLLDLHGAFVMPGFIDSHVHVASAARFLEFNIMKTHSQQEFINRVKNVVQRLEPGEWILGGFWGAYERWAPGSSGHQSRPPFEPDIRQVEERTHENPMFIWKYDDSEYAANQRAIRIAGLDPLRPPPPGVEYIFDERGEWTGRIRGENVRPIFEKVIPREFPYQRRLRQTKYALDWPRKYGITTIHDMSDETQLKIYYELRRKNQLPVRIHFRYPLDQWPILAKYGIRVGGGDPWIRLGAVKGHIDGIMGNHTARFFEPYADRPGERGRWRRLMVDREGNRVEGKFLKYLLDADRAGLQLSVHAIGDEANHVLLNYLETLVRKNGDTDRRFRLVHAQVFALSDFPRLEKLHIIAEVQPYHLSDDMRWMEERIGRERCRGAYAFKSLMKHGAILSFGSDWPGTSASEYPINPLYGIYAAVTRQTLTGEPESGWFPNERLSIEDALRAYTINNAYASFEENIKGSITPGKLADITVLDQNLLTVDPRAILKTRVLYTILDGIIIYDASRPN